jgi:hypothetical protein
MRVRVSFKQNPAVLSTTLFRQKVTPELAAAGFIMR